MASVLLVVVRLELGWQLQTRRSFAVVCLADDFLHDLLGLEHDLQNPSERNMLIVVEAGRGVALTEPLHNQPFGIMLKKSCTG